MKKRFLLLTICLSLVVGLVSCNTDEASVDDNEDDQIEETVEGYLATFDLDEHVSVTIYDTQDYTDGSNSTTAYAKDSDTGEVLTDGEGQINFVVNVDEGYEIDTLLVTPTDNYKNLKDPEELELVDTYRITKVEGDLTVTITTKEEGSESTITSFVGTFILDEHVTVTVYDTSEYVNGVETTTAYAKDSDTGEIVTDGSGQINFVVTVDEGYEVSLVVVASDDNYKNLKDPEELELDNTYRITKITGDLTITITTNTIS